MGKNQETGGTDAQHIEKSLSDPDAFAILFDRHAVPLHRYIVSRVGRRDAADLVGETFSTAFRSRRSYDLKRSDARPWLFGIATNVSHHYWRTEGRRARSEEAASAGADVDDRGEEVLARIIFESLRTPIGKALGQIDGAALDVLLLVAGPEFSYEEVSIALGIPIGTVRSRLARARRRLRELLGDSGQYLDERSSVEQAPIAKGGSS
jgi:RNA polymerase sigma-70 factor (ECF subfamily)